MSDSFPSNEISIQQLDPRIQAQFDKAKSALANGNTDYPFQLASTWVETFPNVPEFRILLRNVQLHKMYPNQSYQKAAASWKSSIPNFFSGKDKNPAKQLLRCEAKLNNDPLDIRANIGLADIAQQLHWGNTEVFALQTLLTNPHRKPEHVVRLANVLLGQEETGKANQLCETFQKVFPEHAGIRDMRNKASIAKSMQRVES